jgi:hypothetical protein
MVGHGGQSRRAAIKNEGHNTSASHLRGSMSQEVPKATIFSNRAVGLPVVVGEFGGGSFGVGVRIEFVGHKSFFADDWRRCAGMGKRRSSIIKARR